MTVHASRPSRGFTLIELMVTIVVVAILAGIALPSLRDFTRRNAVTAHSNAMLADLQYARNDAITRRVVTQICGSPGGAACVDSNAFEQGWVVYRETAPGDTATLGAADEVLRVTQATQGVSIRLVDSGTGAPVDAVGFDQEGSLIGGKAVRFLICAIPNGASIGVSTTHVQGAELSVSASGRPAVRPIPAGAGCGS